ncbi:hypothetical protein [Jannaschia sp. LMIT008]|uniref:hypothetical protein n=1 Tax=Jannaschia maritima TaxID=3032585 RepID=UPI002812393E|nr:hypothetical protein [Jannaschia sp. LMIT008]
MSPRRIAAAAAAVALSVLASVAAAQEAREMKGDGWSAAIAPVSGFTGEMTMTMESETPQDMAVTEAIRFEPWQMLDELFRNDIVFVMRAGPSDWDAPDDPEAGPMDCTGQRPLSNRGDDAMRQLGTLLVVNELRPGRILVSERCAAQQTYAALERGMLNLDMNALDGMTADLDPRLTRLGTRNGGDGASLREVVMDWDGGEGEGPLLVITHFDNVEAMTNFRIYEGEMLMVDPKRDGRVLGYLRLASATPDPLRYPADVVERSMAE